MALKLKNDNYVILDKNGDYWIYIDEEGRQLNKSGVSLMKVIDKYETIISQLTTDDARRYYDYDNWEKEYLAWTEEFTRFMENLRFCKNDDKYPLMQKYYKTINKSIPILKGYGNIGITGDTVAEVYEKVKNLKIFGETQDV